MEYPLLMAILDSVDDLEENISDERVVLEVTICWCESGGVGGEMEKEERVLASVGHDGEEMMIVRWK